MLKDQDPVEKCCFLDFGRASWSCQFEEVYLAWPPEYAHARVCAYTWEHGITHYYYGNVCVRYNLPSRPLRYYGITLLYSRIGV